MIRPEQLAEALDRIPPRDRELLSLSLRRRVPDEALGRLYECSPSEVARRRARAIERLADEMELQRGEDLGAVLKALLEPDTWSQAAATFGEEFAAGGRRSRLAAVPIPEEEPEVEPPPPADAGAPAARSPSPPRRRPRRSARAAGGAGRGRPAAERRRARRPCWRCSPSASARRPTRPGAPCRWR